MWKLLVVISVLGLSLATGEAVHATSLPDFDAWWDFDDPKATEAKFRTLLPSAKAGSDQGYHAELLTQIARTQGLQQQFTQAHATLDQVGSLLHPKLPRVGVRYLLERGRVFNSSGDKERAKPHFFEAWDLARKNHLDGLAVDAAHMVAIAETAEKALAWNLKALDLVEASQDPKAQKWRGSLYNNLGWTYHDRKDYPTALQFFKKALAWRESQHQANEVLIAKWCVARTLRSLGQLDAALAMQQGLDRAHTTARSRDGYVFEELGECLLALHRQAEAAPYFAKAYEMLAQDSWLVKQEGERLQRLKSLGGVP